MGARVRQVLFLCTGNSARSVFAECALNRLGEGRFRAYSAGSQPTGRVHPATLEVLRRKGYETDGLRSKSWDELAVPDGPVLDFVITVCDGARGEACPIWPGRPAIAHWGVPDPAAFQGPDEARLDCFERIHDALERRVRRLVALSPETLDGPAVAEALQEIGEAPPTGLA